MGMFGHIFIKKKKKTTVAGEDKEPHFLNAKWSVTHCDLKTGLKDHGKSKIWEL